MAQSRCCSVTRRGRIDARGPEDLPHRRRCEADTESGQLAMDPPVVLRRILLGQPQRQGLDIPVRGGASRPSPRAARPTVPQQVPVPAQQRSRDKRSAGTATAGDPVATQPAAPATLGPHRSASACKPRTHDAVRPPTDPQHQDLDVLGRRSLTDSRAHPNNRLTTRYTGFNPTNRHHPSSLGYRHPQVHSFEATRHRASRALPHLHIDHRRRFGVCAFSKTAATFPLSQTTERAQGPPVVKGSSPCHLPTRPPSGHPPAAGVCPAARYPAWSQPSSQRALSAS